MCFDLGVLFKSIPRDLLRTAGRPGGPFLRDMNSCVYGVPIVRVEGRESPALKRVGFGV